MNTDDEREAARKFLNRAQRKLRRKLGDGGPSWSMYFNRQGQPIGLGDWAVLFEDRSYQILVQTWTLSGAWVSTVWLGMDHGFRAIDGGPPIIFETMAWSDGNDMLQDRYATESEAIAGHEATVAKFGGRDPNPRNPPNLRPLEWTDDDKPE